MGRDRRHQLIARLLEEESIQSQHRLRMLLAERGLETTQATLSRDLRELGVVKGPQGYSLLVPVAAADVVPTGESLTIDDEGGVDRTLAGSVMSAQLAGHMVVVKTPPGHAQLVAVGFDRKPPEGVVGTVAGDDTIFIACETLESAALLRQTILERAGLKTPAGRAGG